MELKEIVNILNKNLDWDFKFNLDTVYQSLAVYDGTRISGFICYLNSIIKDYSVMPRNFTWDMHANQRLRVLQICYWINEHIFTESLQRLCENKQPLYQTELVRLRIVTNMIDKLDIKRSQKLEWQDYLRLIYYNRHFVMSNYYLDKIIQLPF